MASFPRRHYGRRDTRLRIYRELDTSVVDAWFDHDFVDGVHATIIALVDALDTAMSTRSATPFVDDPSHIQLSTRTRSYPDVDYLASGWVWAY